MSILQQAHQLITGDRQKDYGNPASNLGIIAAQWNSYIEQKYGDIVNLNAEDVCWMMALLKMSRQMHKSSPDNLIDAAGYIGLIEVMAQKEIA